MCNPSSSTHVKQLDKILAMTYQYDKCILLTKVFIFLFDSFFKGETSRTVTNQPFLSIYYASLTF